MSHRSNDEEKPLLFLGKLLKCSGQTQLLKRRDFPRNKSESDTDGTLLIIRIAPETDFILKTVREIHFLVFQEKLLVFGSKELVQKRLRVLPRELRLLHERNKLARNANNRMTT